MRLAGKHTGTVAARHLHRYLGSYLCPEGTGQGSLGRVTRAEDLLQGSFGGGGDGGGGGGGGGAWVEGPAPRC